MSDIEESMSSNAKSDQSSDPDLQNLFEDISSNSESGSIVKEPVKKTNGSKNMEEPTEKPNINENKEEAVESDKAPKLQFIKPINLEKSDIKEPKILQTQEPKNLETIDGPKKYNIKESLEPEKKPIKSAQEPLKHQKLLNGKTFEIDRSKLLSALMKSCQLSANDFKSVGKQFNAGKVDLKSQNRFEARFQQLWKARLKKNKRSNNTSMHSFSTYMPPKYIDENDDDDEKDVKKQKSSNIQKLNLSDYSFYSNDMKYMGRQFSFKKYEKDDEETEPKTNEEKFQELFKTKLEKFKPKLAKENTVAVSKLNKSDLLELHKKLLVNEYREIKNN